MRNLVIAAVVLLAGCGGILNAAPVLDQKHLLALPSSRFEENLKATSLATQGVQVEKFIWTEEKATPLVDEKSDTRLSELIKMKTNEASWAAEKSKTKATIEFEDNVDIEVFPWIEKTWQVKAGNVVFKASPLPVERSEVERTSWLEEETHWDEENLIEKATPWVEENLDETKNLDEKATPWAIESTEKSDVKATPWVEGNLEEKETPYAEEKSDVNSTPGTGGNLNVKETLFTQENLDEKVPLRVEDNIDQKSRPLDMEATPYAEEKSGVEATPWAEENSYMKITYWAEEKTDLNANPWIEEKREMKETFWAERNSDDKTSQVVAMQSFFVETESQTRETK